MITTINNKHKELNFSSEREQSQACLNSAEHEKNQGRKVLNVPNLRFPEFQGEWKVESIKDVADFMGGGTPSSSNESFWQGTIPWVSSSDIVENDIKNISISRYITEEAIAHSATKLCPAPSILIVSRVGVGKIALSKEAICTSQDFCNLINIKVEPIFLTYCLSQIMKRKSMEVQGTSIKGITTSEIQKISINIPSLREQKEIGKILSLLDERIATQNKIIDKLQSLIKGIRNDVFGRLRKSIGFNAMISDVLCYEQPQPYIVENTEYTAEGIPVLTANKAFVLGYTSETNGIYDKGDCIIFDDFTLDCKYVDFPFKVKSSAIKILTAKNKELLRYTFEFLKYLDLSTEEHKRHYIAETQNQEIILPTEQMVKTIAHIFSTLSLRMETAVKQRNVFEKQKQYLLRQMFI